MTNAGIAFTPVSLTSCLGSNEDEASRDAMYSIEKLEIVDKTPTDGNEIRVGTEITDPNVEEDRPAEIVLSVQNTSDKRVDVGAQPPHPFGILRMEQSDGGEDEFVYLWTERYEKSGHITTDTDNRTAAVHNDVGLSYRLSPGDMIEKTYQLHSDTPHLQAGMYELPIRVDAFDSTGSLTEYDFLALVSISEGRE